MYFSLFCIAYIDYIVVYSNPLNEEHVKLSLAKFHKTVLYLKLLKCRYNMQCISIIGFNITTNAIAIKL